MTAYLVRRIGRDKLGVEVSPGAPLTAGAVDRAGVRLRMTLWSARIAAGRPAVPQAAAGVTQYAVWRWGAPEELAAGAEAGSLCCRLAVDWASGSAGSGST